ncbi:hypothetical protein [Pontixanthobacter sp. CEM42]|uniref:hypothetical protein n=1 Tax=Pontixanthobacter sp. CEM42 TaxID=2792077 RepID=UPI001AE059B0|nr:hypothetical protein [Pontixanthobacter sp. CEM42]
MELVLISLLIIAIGAGPVLFASLRGSSRSANITGGITFLLLFSIAVFGPQEPHPFIPNVAMLGLFFLLLGWMIAYVIALWKSPIRESK